MMQKHDNRRAGKEAKISTSSVMMSRDCQYTSNTSYSNHPYLVEFAQVSRIHALVSEHPVDGEVPLRLETAFLVRQTVQHLNTNNRADIIHSCLKTGY